MPIQSDGFTKDPGGSGGGSFTPPTGSGFVKVTGGVLDTASSSLGATDIPVFWVATTTRSTNAFSGSLPTTPAYTAGLTIRWQVPSAPSASPTYNLNSLGAKNIYLNGSAAPVGAFVANRIIEMLYDGTQFNITGFDTLLPGDIASGTATSGYVPISNGSSLAFGPVPAPSAVACQAYKGSSQSVSATTFTECTFDSEVFDTSSIHSTSSNTGRFVAPTNGKYFFATVLFLESIGTTGSHRTYHAKNGTRVRQQHGYAVSGQVLSLVQIGVYDLAANDYLTVGSYGPGTFGFCGETFAAEHSTTATFFRIGD